MAWGQCLEIEIGILICSYGCWPGVRVWRLDEIGILICSYGCWPGVSVWRLSEIGILICSYGGWPGVSVWRLSEIGILICSYGCWLGVNISRLSETGSLICSFYHSMAARTIVETISSLRLTVHVPGTLSSREPSTAACVYVHTRMSNSRVSHPANYASL